MSDLSFIKKLLDGAEVEWVPLRQVVNITTGKKTNSYSRYCNRF